jgi:hypothetical protein
MTPEVRSREIGKEAVLQLTRKVGSHYVSFIGWKIKLAHKIAKEKTFSRTVDLYLSFPF